MSSIPTVAQFRQDHGTAGGMIHPVHHALTIGGRCLAATTPHGILC